MSERDWTGKHQCYLHVQTTWPEGSGQAGKHIIISGHGETPKDAVELFNPALKAYREDFKKDG